MRAFSWTVLMIFIGTFSLFGQECSITLTGKVFDHATHEPMEYAAIGIVETSSGVMTDSAGSFIIHGICPGSYHIGVEHLGCDPVRVFLKINRDTSITIYIDHHGELLREITVSGTQSERDETNTQNVFTSAHLKNQAGQNLADITEQIAGVYSLRNGSGISKPVIHGMFGNRVAVINNGMRQAGQQWGSDHAPEIDPASAGSIRVIKGSDAIEYGSQAMGGAVIVDAGTIPKDPHPHGFVGYAFESNGQGHTAFANLSKSGTYIDWKWTGSFRKEGDHQAPGYLLTNTGVNQTGTSIQLNFHPKESIHHELFYSLFHTNLGIFAGSHISNLTDLESAIHREVPFQISENFSYRIQAPRQKVTHHLLTYAGKKFFSPDKSLEWSYGVQSNHRQEYDIRRGELSTTPALDLQLWSHQAQVKLQNQLRSFKYEAGMQAGWIDNVNDYETGILPLIPDYTKGSGAVFLQTKVPFKNGIFEFGGRYDLQKIKVWAISQSLPREILIRNHTYHDMALAIGVLVKEKEFGETRLHNVLIRRSPEVNELYSNGLHQGIAGIEEGNWSLKPEISNKSILTQSVRIDNILFAEASVYSHLIGQYIYLQPEDELRLTIRGAFPVYQYKQEDAWLRGIDFLFISDFSHRIELRTAISFIRGTTIKNQAPLSFVPPVKWSSRFSWTIKDSNRFTGTRLSLEASYTGKQKHWNQEEELLAPPEDYFLLAPKFETAVRTGSDFLHIGIIADNLLNVRYRDYLNRLRYFADEQGRSVRVTIRYEF